MNFVRHLSRCLPYVVAFGIVGARSPEDSLHAEGMATESAFTVLLDQPKQVIKGLGFELQSDSIGSGNRGLPDNRIAVPHDLTLLERQRLAREMLQGFRYCRLAGGLYWRGLDAERKHLQPRWPEQLAELHELLTAAGVEGVSFEYWSPAPFWKGNQSYVGTRNQDPGNRLRCFSPGFDRDALYHGDTNRFLADFAKAVVTDIQTLKAAGIKTSLWGLQNEPFVNHEIYSTCEYPDSANYVKAYRAVAGAVRKADPSILLFADTEGGFPKKIGPGMRDPEVAALVDAYAVHLVGSPAESVPRVNANIAAQLPPRPWFQNEYEYLTGGATPDRCLNTVQHIMNSFQLAGNPTWFWIHALKPLQNAEASGYSLGFWKSLEDPGKAGSNKQFRRWSEGPEFTRLPASLTNLEMILPTRGSPQKPGVPYAFSVNQPVTVYLLAEDCGALKLDAAWKKTAQTATWTGGRDEVYQRQFPAGNVNIPAHTGKQGDRYGAPDLVFLEPANPANFKAMIGINVPIQIRSEALALERKAALIQPGHWIFNPYNWHAVGSFVKHMPWNCVAITVAEPVYDAKARIFAFKKPDGKLCVVLSNRSDQAHTFHVATGLSNAIFKGFRYTPDEAGQNCGGVEIGTLNGGAISPKLGALTWEFWEQQ